MKVVWFHGTKINVVTLPKISIQQETRDLQRLVGGFLEVVSLADDAALLVDEEGLIKCHAINRAASMFAGQMIVGPAVLVGIAQNADGECYFTDFPRRFGFKED